MKKVLLLLSVSATFVVLFASAALSQQTSSPEASASVSASATTGASATAGSSAVTISAASSVSPSASASATTTASATASARALAKTGGPSHVAALASGAALVLIVSGLAALRLVVRRDAS